MIDYDATQFEHLPELDELPEFDYQAHEQIHSVHVGNKLLLEVYAVGDSYRWELVDNCGRTHRCGVDVPNVAQALSDGAASAGLSRSVESVATAADPVQRGPSEAEQDEWVRGALEMLDDFGLEMD